jgi:hypothetical protein
MDVKHRIILSAVGWNGEKCRTFYVIKKFQWDWKVNFNEMKFDQICYMIWSVGWLKGEYNRVWMLQKWECLNGWVEWQDKIE